MSEMNSESSTALPATPHRAPPPVWVPIRSLLPRHRERITAHLMQLETRDRYLRFGFPATDEQITRYTVGIDFTRDEVFGIFNRKLQLIAVAHLAYAAASQKAAHRAMAEFGVSVLASARGRGFGARLFGHSILHARNRGVHTLFIHALSENVTMLKIARNAGAVVKRDGSESEAWLELPRDTLASRMGQIVEDHAAEFDYRFKRQTLRASALAPVLTDTTPSSTEASQSKTE